MNSSSDLTKTFHKFLKGGRFPFFVALEESNLLSQYRFIDGNQISLVTFCSDSLLYCFFRCKACLDNSRAFVLPIFSRYYLYSL
ncbi:hypothetical protein CW304_27680 [Bacillus sp. UFRGS-B20]|nr:hypothetical protein CW304_27680 [Bacillus sp. UFRGS-B20]